MKTYYVKDLEKGLVLNNESFAVKLVESAQTKDGKPFFKLILADKTGEIKAQIWADNIPNIEKSALIAGNVILINAMVEDYRGVLQLNILKASKIDETLLSEYMEASDFELDDLLEQLKKHVTSIKDKNIQKFLESIIADENMGPKLKTYPAAEYVHHAFQGGLLEHTVEMLDLAMPLKKYYKEANFDYIIAGIVLHDLGKLFELEPVGVTIQRTREGYLVGHLVKSYEILLERGPKYLNQEQILNLKHIILSHHGYLEFGSPVVPATIEAIIVSYVDQLSSKARIFQKIIRKNSESDSEFAEFDRTIGVKVYLGDRNPSDTLELI